MSLGLREPLMVVGRETTLASGAVDLLAVTPDGDILIIEFKTGPKNPDFRAALAQLLDYGSDLWQLNINEFEAAVAVRYFQGVHCPPKSPAKGATGLLAAAQATWPAMDETALTRFAERVSDALTRGAFHYLVVAQRFTDPMESTVRYLNQIASPARFYLVEVVRFEGGGLNAFEARTILKPEASRTQSSASVSSETAFLGSLGDDEYRETCQGLFELCRGLGLRFEWGSKGTSIRIQVPQRAQPVSVAWVFPPGVGGWMGLTHLTFGFDGALEADPKTLSALTSYAEQVATLPGSTYVTKAGLKASTFEPKAFVSQKSAITEVLAQLVATIAGDE